MPACNNDASRSYSGLEPSPKGAGFCAHAEEVGSIRTGKDGGQWIVASQGKHKRWVPHNPTRSLLEAKLNPWWQKLAEGGAMVVKANGAHAMIGSSKVTRAAQIKDRRTQWEAAAADDDVVAIVWSPMSRDALEHFVNFVCKRPGDASKMARGDAVAMLAKSHATYFVRERLYTNKDHLLRGAA